MIMNELQTMPYYFSDEIAPKPYNHYHEGPKHLDS